MAVTISSIARTVGVSRFSVSCALNGRDDQVSAETRARIVEAAQRLGYRPNTAARAARSGRFHAAAFVQRTGSSLFPQGLIASIDRTLRAHRMHLVAAHVEEADFGDPSRTPRIFSELCVDGILANQGRDVPDRIAKAIKDMRLPVIWLNSKQAVDAVFPDEFAHARRLTQELLELGHRRIAFCRFRPIWRRDVDHYSHIDRIAGYESAMREAGLSPWVEVTDYPVDAAGEVWGNASDDRLERGLGVLQRPDRPTAILAPDASSAMPLFQSALAAGLRPGRDLVLVAISDKPMHEMAPGITTAIIPFERIGAEGVALLDRKIERPSAKLSAVAVDYGPYVGQALARPMNQ